MKAREESVMGRGGGIGGEEGKGEEREAFINLSTTNNFLIPKSSLESVSIYLQMIAYYIGIQDTNVEH